MIKKLRGNVQKSDKIADKFENLYADLLKEQKKPYNSLDRDIDLQKINELMGMNIM